jgi:uncharacterized protein (DUF2252 family)
VPEPVTVSVAERAARGRAARKRAPRRSQGHFEPPSDRPDPVELLERQAKTRVSALVPIRYGRMLVSPLTFYRGAALIMASDLSQTPRSGLTAQCCGDAHLLNFGLFASPERQLVFDVNDFDETLPGPWEWDVKRLATSVLIAARGNGCSAKRQEQAVLDTVEEYRTAMRRFAAMGSLQVWYSHLDVDDTFSQLRSQLTPKLARNTEQTLAKTRTHSSMSALSKLTEVVDGVPHIRAEPPLIVPLAELAEGEERAEIFDVLHHHVRSYVASLERDRRVLIDQFRLLDFARKVVGVGSVGTRDWITLLLGRDEHEPLFLQLKEAQASVLEEFVAPSEFKNHGERVVTGQRLMQASSDIFLGWLHAEASGEDAPRDFYVRQLRDWKGSAEVEQMNAKGLSAYGRLCGWTLARAHARSGDPVAIASYLGRGAHFDRAIVAFANDYAEQNQRDYRALAAAASAGRITVETGV